MNIVIYQLRYRSRPSGEWLTWDFLTLEEALKGFREEYPEGGQLVLTRTLSEIIDRRNIGIVELEVMELPYKQG